jgi:hypothetical protein
MLRGAPRMGSNRLAFIDRHRRHREGLAQVHLRRIGLGGKAFALLTEYLATKPLDLVLESGDLLVLHRNRVSLRTRQGSELRGAHRGGLGEGR